MRVPAADGHEGALRAPSVIVEAGSIAQFIPKGGRLLANPKATVQAEGLPFPEGADVHVVKTNDRLYYLPLPPKPAACGISGRGG